MDFLTEQTTEEREVLFSHLKSRRKEFLIEVIVSLVFIFIAPNITFRSHQKPLITIMTYWQAVCAFALIFLVVLIVTYFFRLHKKVKSLQNNRKRNLITRVSSIYDFSKGNKTSLFFDNPNFKYLDIQTDQNIFKVNDHVLVEFSELGRQFLKIQIVESNDLVTMKTTESEPPDIRHSYFEILLSKKPIYPK